MKRKNQFYDNALKRAELLLSNQPDLTVLLDKAFDKMGNITHQIYDLQDHLLGLLNMLQAWVKREYTDVSPKAIVAMLAAIIYFVNPFDLISDIIPVFGFMDDIAIITYVVAICNKEIEKFMTWEKEKASTS